MGTTFGESKDENELKAGDHIFVYRTPTRLETLIPFQHHGIYVGDGSVIHVNGPDKNQSKVIITSLKEFQQKGIINVVRYNVGTWDKQLSYAGTAMCSTSDNPKKVCERAYSVLHSNPRDKKYDLFKNNCEHFAVWCKTGKYYSAQTYMRSFGNSAYFDEGTTNSETN